jgi:hypothetical protein
MQAVLPFGALVVLAVGVVLLGLALDAPVSQEDRGGVTWAQEASPDGTRVVAVKTHGSPSWLDVGAHTVDGVPIPHRYEGRDERVDRGEALVLLGHGDRHIGATVVFNGAPSYVVEEVVVDDPPRRV